MAANDVLLLEIVLAVYYNGLWEETRRPLEHPQTEINKAFIAGVVFLQGKCAMVLSISINVVLRLDVCSIKKFWYNFRKNTFGEHSCKV